MKETLNFIKDSIATTATVEQHKYVCSKDGYIHAFNGTTYACHPISDCPDFIVDGRKLLTACNMSNWKHELKASKVNLLVKHNTMSVKLPLAGEFNIKGHKDTFKQRVPINFYDVLQHLQPFMSRDASRPWSTSVYIKEGVACTTNNVAIVFADLDMPDMLIPADMVDMILSTKKCPVSVCTDNGLQFFYDNKAFVYCTGLTADYPDVSQFHSTDELPLILPEFYEAVKTLCQYDTEGVLIMKDGILSNGEAEVSGFDLPDFAFYVEPFLPVILASYSIDFSTFPLPCKFEGANVKGVVIGVQV